METFPSGAHRRRGWSTALVTAALALTSVLAVPSAAEATIIDDRPEGTPTVVTRKLEPGKHVIGNTVVTIGNPVRRAQATTDGDDPPQTYPGWDICAFDAYGYRGWVYCAMEWSTITWIRGEDTFDEFFVIGTNWAVWHIWPTAGGWRSLGGRAAAANGNGAFTAVNPVVVMTFGTDLDLWCRYRGNGSWGSGWSRC